MANTINYDKQILFNGNGYLDKSIEPKNTFSELQDINLATLFEGFEVVVLQDENYDNETTRYIWKGAEKGWVLKNPIIEYNDIK